MRRCEKVAIVGGGFAGLLSIKSLKEEGIEPVCFEKSSEIGGTWCYRTESKYGCASTMSTTITNNSKEMLSISNYTFPDDAPNYMRHDELYRHMLTMAKTFDLLKHVMCNREVVKVEKASDYEETGRWVVIVKNTESGEVSSDVYDAVLVCVGHFAHPEIPRFPGMNDFQGKIMHTHSLKTFEQFTGKRIVVVGTGCSALDAAEDISNVADKVYLSVRTPSWIMPRLGPYGLPFDYLFLRRYIMFSKEILPTRWASKIFEMLFLDPKFHHTLYGIEPKYPFLCHIPIVNDTIPSKLLSGTVLLRKHIVQVKKEGVIFEQEEEETKVETIIMATGYRWDYSFLQAGTVVEEKPGKFLLYKNMYPVHLPHPTLALIGFLLPIGPGFPIGELQTRWAAYLLSGKGSLPSKEVMKEDVDRRSEDNTKRYSPSHKMSIRVDTMPYMDEIASEIGAKPNFWRMLFTDPRLCFACIFGPSLPYQYRLKGSHRWNGARNAILEAPRRVMTPLCGRNASQRIQRKENHILHTFLTFVLLTVLFLLRHCFFKYYILTLTLPYFLSVGIFSRKLLLFSFLLPYLFTGCLFEICIPVFFALQLFVVAFLF